MTAWTAEQLTAITANQDLFVSPLRADGVTYGTPTQTWALVVDGNVYVRAANGPASRWYQAAITQKAGRVRVAGQDYDVRLKPPATRTRRRSTPRTKPSIREVPPCRSCRATAQIRCGADLTPLIRRMLSPRSKPPYPTEDARIDDNILRNHPSAYRAHCVPVGSRTRAGIRLVPRCRHRAQPFGPAHRNRRRSAGEYRCRRYSHHILCTGKRATRTPADRVRAALLPPTDADGRHGRPRR